MALSCADFRIIFVLGSLGLLPRSLKIKRTNEVIDDLDLPDFHPPLLFVGRIGLGTLICSANSHGIVV